MGLETHNSTVTLICARLPLSRRSPQRWNITKHRLQTQTSLLLSPLLKTVLQQTGSTLNCKNKQSKHIVRVNFKVSLTFSVHIWFPLNIPNSHVAASCCVMEWKDCNNKAHDPRPPFLIHCYCTHIFVWDQMTDSPSCLWPSKHLFGLLMNICMCLPGSIVCVCWGVSGILYGTSSLLIAGVAHWSFWTLTEGGRAHLAPELKTTSSKTNQTLLPSPPMSARKWQAGTFCPAAIHN